MKKIIKTGLLKSLCFVLIASTLINSSCVFAGSSSDMVVFKEGKYVGLTEEAKTLIKNSRETLLRRKEVFSGKFRQFESVYHVAHIMRMIKGNMFLYGPPGGAKSYFVNWILDYEEASPFKVQMHQMMTEQVFVGGQDYEAAKKGEYVVNVKGSLADHKTAVIDEMDKGNPATLAALLSLLNERTVYLGSETFKSSLETIFSTSNKNLYEIYAEFEKNGQGSTADALLNRFSCIAFVPNWLEKKDQLVLDQGYLSSLNEDFYAEQEELDKAALQLDWDGLRSLAHSLFVPTDDFSLIVRELINKLREDSINFIDRQENQYDQDALPYYPTVQYTERLRQKVTEVILMSLVLDFLTSPLTEDIDKLEETLKNTEKSRFSITPLSLWRSYPILTTVSYGAVELNLSENDASHMAINFGDFLDNYKGENKRVGQMIEYIKQERNIFKSALEAVWQDHKDAVKDASSSAAMFECFKNGDDKFSDIERILFVTNRR
jgi:MoxR-like ATPase